MKIETKFGIGDTVYFLSPEGWNWMDFGEARVVEEAHIKKIIQAGPFLFYEVYLPDMGVSLTLSENEFYADEEEAQKACTAWNKLHGLEEDKENESKISVDKDFLKNCESTLDRIEKKLDLLIGKMWKA